MNDKQADDRVVLAPEKPDTKHIPRPPDKKAVAAKVAGRISAGKPRARRAA